MAATQHLTSSPLMRTIGAPGPGKVWLMRHDRVDVVLWFCTLSFIGSTSTADILPYRVVLFAGDLGPDRLATATVPSVWVATADRAWSRWPALGPSGDGLRFRIADRLTIVGTACEAQGGVAGELTSCRGMVWRIGQPGAPDVLPILGTTGGSMASAVNPQGLAVGAVIDASVQTASAIRAAVWQVPLTGDGSDVSIRVIEPDPAWTVCNEDGTSTWFTAISPNGLAGGEAAAVISVGSLGGGSGCASGVSVVPPMGPIGPAARLHSEVPSQAWCASLSDSAFTEFAACIGLQPSPALTRSESWAVMGSQRQFNSLSAMCVHGQEWDGVAWRASSRSVIARHCDCADGGALPPCIDQDSSSSLSYRLADVRLGVFMPSDQTRGRPALAGGCMGIDIRTTGQECTTDDCPAVHAFVQIDPLGPGDSRALLDLHSVIPSDDVSELVQSAVAAVIERPPDESSALDPGGWMALGVISSGVWYDEDVSDARGAFWLSRIDQGDLQWCFQDANDVSLRAPGWTIQALHDATSDGILVGVARRAGERRLCYLTSCADLNGDLFVDGADLGSVLTHWGQRGAAMGDDPAIDLNGDDIVDGADLGVTLTAWTGPSPGAQLRVTLDCNATQWRQAIERLPYIESAAVALGFDDLDGLAGVLLPASRIERESLCNCLSILAIALEDAHHD